MNLTEAEFWDKYWEDCRLPSEVDQKFSFDRCLAAGLKQHLHATQGRVLEIGCAPGKWLAFMAKVFGLEPAGIEYSIAGMLATKRNFELLNLVADGIVTGDFFELEPRDEYDVVMSFGFIEHFENPEDVVARHLDWVRPGGKLVLGVPNFNGVYKPLQRMLKPEILEKHNLTMMNIKWFDELASQFNMKALHIGFLGSFEPALPVSDRGVRNIRQLLVKMLLRVAHFVRKLRWFDRFNHPLFSSYILAVYQKSKDN